MMEPVQTFTPETLAEVLVCTRTVVDGVDGDTSKRILALATSAPDWDALLAAAFEHSLTPIFCKNLEAHAGEALPRSWRRRFNEELLRNSCRNLAQTAELFGVLHALEGQGVCATPYK